MMLPLLFDKFSKISLLLEVSFKNMKKIGEFFFQIFAMIFLKSYLLGKNFLCLFVLCHLKDTCVVSFEWHNTGQSKCHQIWSLSNTSYIHTYLLESSHTICETKVVCCYYVLQEKFCPLWNARLDEQGQDDLFSTKNCESEAKYSTSI